jgi:hypothetical protein
MEFRRLWLACLFILPAQTFAQNALYLGVEDPKIFKRQVHQLYIDNFKKLRPELNLYSVIVPKDVAQLGEGASSAFISNHLRALGLVDASIEVMLIGTHGETYSEGLETRTSLVGIGGFGESKVDANLMQALSPLIGKFTPDTRIVMNACNTFCGYAFQIEDRAKVLFNFLKIKVGQVYGSKTPEIAMVSNRFWYLFTKPRFYIAPIVAFLGVQLELISYITHGPPVVGSSIALGIYSSIIGVIAKSQNLLAAQMEGYVAKISENAEINLESLNKVENYSELIGVRPDSSEVCNLLMKHR